jgi:hypothetical protein
MKVAKLKELREISLRIEDLVEKGKIVPVPN